jgi:tRNA dimethylallyltransferase
MALTLRTDIIVADSRQVYQGMDIATNKPSAASRQKIRRHLIDLIPPHTPFSAGAYKRAAQEVIVSLEKEEKPILIEGGTGLYIKALLYGLWNGPPKDIALWQTFSDMEKRGESLHQKLIEVDPASAKKIHVKDRYKIGRALEVFYSTGQPLSSFHAQHQLKKDPIPPFTMIGLRRDRATLYRRIEERVDQQFQEGLVEETQRLIGMSLALPSMRALGYKQVIPYLQGTRTLDEAISLVKQDTRHYAKRQMTWFSADKNITWLDLKEDESPEETSTRIKGGCSATVCFL